MIKKNRMLIILAVLGVLLIFLPKLGNSEDGHVDETESYSYYSEHLENKIADLVSKVSGVGEVSVVITLDSGGETVYAENTKISGTQSAAEYIVIKDSDGEKGLVVGKLYPEVRGVAVVCGGGSSPTVKNEVTQLIAAALGISTSRIKVCGGE